MLVRKIMLCCCTVGADMMLFMPATACGAVCSLAVVAIATSSSCRFTSLLVGLFIVADGRSQRDRVGRCSSRGASG